MSPLRAAVGRWLLPTPAGPARQRLSLRSSHSSEARNSNVGRGSEEAVRSNPSRVLGAGKPAAFRRARSLEASREAISSRTRV